ncbi:MAG: SDR family oxidoreductase [Desulfuromonadales bacterium]|nr:MAG: SDR family oxidoreductase [Desulfuromonadales bacterium]
MNLKGKTAIISGGGRGLGRAAAVALAREGADLVIMSRTAHELEETASAVMAEGGTVVIQEGDSGNPGDVHRVVETAVESFGTVDILLNNAAVIAPIRLLHQIEVDEWERAMATNLTGPWLLARQVIPHMIRQKGGKIINVTSGLGEIVMPPFGAYGIAKAALIHMTRYLSEELKIHNIQVNGLDPAVMDTSMQAEIRGFGPAVLGADVYAQFSALKECGRLQPPEHAARLVAFLASADSDRITGEIGTESHYRQLGFKC